MPHHILVAADGSDHSMKAAELAGELSGKLGAPVTVLHVHMHGRPVAELARMAEVEHVLDDPSPRTMPRESELPRTMQELMHLTDRQVAQLDIIDRIGDLVLEQARTRVEDAGATDVSTRIGTGDYADAILDTAEAVGADMIVLGSRGLGQLRGLLMGSVSHKVAQNAACTVVIVK
jgi:nucleotide-binding universal stress UspA family protein